MGNNCRSNKGWTQTRDSSGPVVHTPQLQRVLKPTVCLLWSESVDLILKNCITKSHVRPFSLLVGHMCLGRERELNTGRRSYLPKKSRRQHLLLLQVSPSSILRRAANSCRCLSSAACCGCFGATIFMFTPLFSRFLFERRVILPSPVTDVDTEAD